MYKSDVGERRQCIK